jgi:CRP/FNR family transcriptional regulator
MIDNLRQNPLFRGLEEAELEKIRGIASVHSFRKGTSLFSQGEAASGLYLVISGRVKIYRLSPQGQEYVMRIVGPGETLAEAAVFSGQTYPASAEVLEESSLIYLRKSDFLLLIKESPQLALNMITGLSQLLRQLARQVEDLSLKEVSARLARFLIEEATQKCPTPDQALRISLEIKKNLLAGRLGTIGETLSRTLAKMKQKGLIEISGNMITIIDLESLKEIAEGSKL